VNILAGVNKSGIIETSIQVEAGASGICEFRVRQAIEKGRCRLFFAQSLSIPATNSLPGRFHHPTACNAPIQHTASTPEISERPVFPVLKQVESTLELSPFKLNRQSDTNKFRIITGPQQIVTIQIVDISGDASFQLCVYLDCAACPE
jgi:hypothetical protein